MKRFDYHKPETLQEFFTIEHSPETMILAGGTDILPKMHYGNIYPERLIDISLIREMNFVCENEEARDQETRSEKEGVVYAHR